MNRTVSYCMVLLVVFSWGYSATAVAEIVSVGTAYREGSLATVGFPNFLDDANATTRAANFNSGDEILNGVSVQACDGYGIAGFLTLSNILAASWDLEWSNDPQESAKNDISGTGFYSKSAEGMQIAIAATANKTYHVELLSCTVPNGAENRVFDIQVSLDGGSNYTTYVSGLLVPGISGTASTVYEFDVVTGSQGIRLKCPSGTDGGTYHEAFFNAMSITEVPEPSTLVLLATGLIGLLAYAWRKHDSLQIPSL